MTLQHGNGLFTPKSGYLTLINNSCELKNQGCGKPKRGPLGFSWLPDKPHLHLMGYGFPSCRDDPVTMKRKRLENVFRTWSIVSGSSSDQDTHFTGQVIQSLKTSQTF